MKFKIIKVVGEEKQKPEILIYYQSNNINEIKDVFDNVVDLTKDKLQEELLSVDDKHNYTKIIKKDNSFLSFSIVQKNESSDNNELVDQDKENKAFKELEKKTEKLARNNAKSETYHKEKFEIIKKQEEALLREAKRKKNEKKKQEAIQYLTKNLIIIKIMVIFFIIEIIFVVLYLFYFYSGS